MKKHIELSLRYLNMRNGEEKGFRHGEKRVRLKPEETAFVLVDVWDVSRVSERIKTSCGYKSHFKRANKIVAERIKPSLEAARKLNLTIIHLPTEYTAIKYPQYKRLKEELNLPAKSSTATDIWPPKDFVRKIGLEFQEERYWKGFQEENRKRQKLTYIHKLVRPRKDEYVITNGDEMNEVLRRRKIFNLIYVGFAANMCIVDKPGAMREMAKRGYRTILLRDCTTAFENHNTVDELLMTKLWIEWIEMCTIGYTTNSEDFIKASNNHKIMSRHL